MGISWAAPAHAALPDLLPRPELRRLDPIAGEVALVHGEELGLDELFDRHRRERLLTVPATDIAREKLGRPIPNAALLGGFAALSGMISIESVAQAIREKFSGKIAAGNVGAAESAFQAVHERMKEVAHA